MVDMMPCPAANTNYAINQGTSSYMAAAAAITCFTKSNFPRMITPRGVMIESPDHSYGFSVSLDEIMSTFDFLHSPKAEHVDDSDWAAVDSIVRDTHHKRYISDHLETTEIKKDRVAEKGTSDEIVNIDNNFMDPQLCATMACDIYKHLRESELKKRPSINYLEKVQKNITSNMRATLVDWLVEVVEVFRLVPDTLYLAVNYMDRYLSANTIDREWLQLLGISCMMIASKYENICHPQVEDFCYITDNTYSRNDVLEMESEVLDFLKFELTIPTVKCFLTRFVRAAQGDNTEDPSMQQLKYMANYLAELSLLEYSTLCYSPSLIAASAIFLAKYILSPTRKPWNSTLQHYTLYEPSDLCECVEALHTLSYESLNSSFPAIRVKYSQEKYKFVAKRCLPASIPPEYFLDLSS